MEYDLSQHKYIVFADGHFNSLGLVRSLGMGGLRPDIIAVNANGCLATHSRYHGDIINVPTIQEGLEYVMTAYSNLPYKSFILTGNDVFVYWIDKYYDKLKNSFYFFNCGTEGRLSHFLSKSEQNKIALKAGFSVPKFEEVTKGELPKDLTYPIITKAINSTVPFWKSVTHLCRNENDLKEAYSKIDCEKVLLQEYIEKSNETGFNGFSINHGHLSYFPLQLAYHYTKETTFGNSIYLFRPQDADLCDKIRTFIDYIGFEGLFSIDFIIDRNNKVYFLEINMRNSAWSYPYSMAGVNLPLLWIKSTLTNSITANDVKITKLPFSAIVELDELGVSVKEGLLKELKRFYMILKAIVIFTETKKEARPFINKLKEWIASRI